MKKKLSLATRRKTTKANSAFTIMDVWHKSTIFFVNLTII